MKTPVHITAAIELLVELDKAACAEALGKPIDAVTIEEALAYLDYELVAAPTVPVDLTPSDRLQAIRDTRDAFDGSLATWHDFVLNQIECVTEHGLPAVYNGRVFGFLCDLFGGDMPWTPDKSEAVTRAIRQSPRFEPLRAAFQRRFGVDFWGDDEEI